MIWNGPARRLADRAPNGRPQTIRRAPRKTLSRNFSAVGVGNRSARHRGDENCAPPLSLNLCESARSTSRGERWNDAGPALKRAKKSRMVRRRPRNRGTEAVLRNRRAGRPPPPARPSLPVLPKPMGWSRNSIAGRAPIRRRLLLRQSDPATCPARDLVIQTHAFRIELLAGRVIGVVSRSASTFRRVVPANAGTHNP